MHIPILKINLGNHSFCLGNCLCHIGACCHKGQGVFHEKNVLGKTSGHDVSVFVVYTSIKKLTFKNKLTLFIEVKGVTAPVSRKIHTSQKYLGYSLT